MIAESAHIEDDVSLGARTYVWHRAHIRTGASIGADCVIGSDVFVDRDVSIGDRSKIQNKAQLFSPATIGNGVFIGPSVVLTNDQVPRAVNPNSTPKSATDWQATPVVIADGASVGAGAVIVAGVTIGKWAMVGAGAVVTRDVLSHELVAGVPARNLGWVDRAGNRLEAVNDEWRSADGNEYRMTAAGLEEVPR